MANISDRLTIPLHSPPRIALISRFVIAEPHSFECCSTKRWGLDIWDCPGRVVIVDRKLTLDIHPGEMLITPPRSHIIASFPAGRRSWYASFEAAKSTRNDDRIAVQLELHEQQAALCEAMRRAVRVRPTQPSRAVQLLWGVLLDLVELSRRPASPTPHPVIAAALEWIEQHLSEPFSVTQLARSIHVGRTVLSRLFRRYLGQSVVEYLRVLRVSRAEAMLTQTDLPIKEVAIRVGLPDPQHFNKTVRRQLGASPSEIRRRNIR